MMKKKSIGTGTAVLLTAAVLYGCAGNSIPAGTEHSAEAQETSASEAAETLGAEDAAETLAVIEDEAVALPQIIQHIVKMTVLECSGFPVQHQHPGMIPRFDRLLRDTILGKLIKKVLFFHRVCLSFLLFLQTFRNLSNTD